MSASSHRLVVHHLNNSRSQRVLWLLVRLITCITTPRSRSQVNLFPIKEELEVPYDIKFYQRNPDFLAPKELLDVHPLGKAPVITDGDITLAESGAIIRVCFRFICGLD